MNKAPSHGSIHLGTLHFKEANEMIRAELLEHDLVELKQVFAQRYLGAALGYGKKLEIQGVPGNDLACYLDGGSIEVFGNGQDQIGNTMNDGEIIIHGRCGDAVGYGMRGGSIFIREDCGWRVGIHMKEYADKCPVIVIGGDAGSFLGEYMAGGIILLLGKPGNYLATGMHGGKIYLAEKLPSSKIAPGLVQESVDEEDIVRIGELLSKYHRLFSCEMDNCPAYDPQRFFRVLPASSRPYESMYAS